MLRSKRDEESRPSPVPISGGTEISNHYQEDNSSRYNNYNQPISNINVNTNVNNNNNSAKSSGFDVAKIDAYENAVDGLIKSTRYIISLYFN